MPQVCWRHEVITYTMCTLISSAAQSLVPYCSIIVWPPGVYVHHTAINILTAHDVPVEIKGNVAIELDGSNTVLQK